MAINLTSAWCSGVAYSVPGYSWAVGDYVQYAEGACTGFTSDNGVWVTIPLWDFEQILTDAQAYNNGTTASTTQFTTDEVQALKYQAANPSPFNLTLEEGALIASAVLGCWGVAVCWRSLAAFLRGGDSGDDPR